MRKKPDPLTMVAIPCPLCGARPSSIIYRAEKRTGTLFGRVVVTLSQCKGCGFVYNSPRPRDADLARYYAEDILASGGVFRSEGKSAYYPQLFRERVDFFAPFLRGRASAGTSDAAATGRDSRLLDIGCGTGGLLKAFAAADLEGWSLSGMEPSERSAEALAEQGVEIVRAYLGEPGYADASFDAISLISVLEHLGDPLSAMHEITRMLKPGGIVLLEVPNTLQPELCLTGFFGLEHICHYSPGTLRTLFEAVGLSEMRVDGAGRDNSIRLVASSNLKAWGGAAAEDYPEDSTEVEQAVRRYEMRERKFLGELEERVQGALDRWATEERRIAIYGAGAHTAELSVRFDLLRHADCIIDGDEDKQGRRFLGLPVVAPEELTKRGIDAVLLSSHRFVDEMEQTVRRLGGSSVDIQRCYEGIREPVRSS